jgi:hypothetical protein
MELLLGSHVREHGNRVGRLAGLELDPATRRVRRILYSPDGDVGAGVETRPLSAVALVHDDGEIELRPYGDGSPMPVTNDVTPLTRATRLKRGGRVAGRFAGVELEPGEGALVLVFVRNHWWSRRLSVPAPGLDFSVSGEIRTGAGGSRAA